MDPLVIALIAVAWLGAALFAWAIVHGAQKLHRAERRAREAALAEDAHFEGLVVLPRSPEVFDVDRHAA
jgi:hypothetical protein